MAKAFDRRQQFATMLFISIVVSLMFPLILTTLVVTFTLFWDLDVVSLNKFVHLSVIYQNSFQLPKILYE